METKKYYEEPLVEAVETDLEWCLLTESMEGGEEHAGEGDED